MHISYYLPETIQHNTDLLKRFDLQEDFLDSKIGVRQRRVVSANQATSDLCVEAAKILAAENPDFQAAAVDLVLLCTQNGDFKLPHTSAIIQSRLGLSKQAMCFDISLGCSGFIYGLSIIKGLFSTSAAQSALFFTCDPYTKVIDPKDKNTVLLFGDAAAVTWIRKEDVESGLEIGEFDFGTDGALFDSLIIRKGGTVDPFPPEGISPREDAGYRYFMDGRNVYQSVVRYIPENMKRCLGKNRVSFDDIDHFVFHQASAHILSTLQRLLRIPEEKMVRDFSDIGNTVSSTIPIALARLGKKTPLRGKTVFLCGFGVGLSWGAVVVHF